jgi:hypothetical protein
VVVVGLEIELLTTNVIAQREEDYFVFVCSIDIVIPGRSEATNPESRDSGFASSTRPGMTVCNPHGEEALLQRRLEP